MNMYLIAIYRLKHITDSQVNMVRQRYFNMMTKLSNITAKIHCFEPMLPHPDELFYVTPSRLHAACEIHL